MYRLYCTKATGFSLTDYLRGVKINSEAGTKTRKHIMNRLAHKLFSRARIAAGRLRRQYRYRRSFHRFSALYARTPAPRLPLSWKDRMPILGEDTAGTQFDRHYIFHPAWAARILAETKPAEHVDISSTLAFCTLVSAFIPVRFYDFRPADLRLSGLISEAADVTCLPFADGSIPSLSCMHTLEHIGLGRYGDPLDVDGDLKGMRELARVLAPGGNLLVAVPLGRPGIRFNGHRVYDYQRIVQDFAGLTLHEFSLVTDPPGNPGYAQNGFIRHATQAQADRQVYGCGCFWFKKPSTD